MLNATHLLILSVALAWLCAPTVGKFLEFLRSVTELGSMNNLVLKKCILSGCARPRETSFMFCGHHLWDAPETLMFCQVCKGWSGCHEEQCFECCKRAANERSARLKQRQLTDETLLKELELLDKYRELGSYEKLAYIRGLYDIEQDCKELGLQ